MRKHMKVLSVVLALLMLLPLLFGCNKTKDDEGETTSASQQNTETTAPLTINGVAASEYTVVYSKENGGKTAFNYLKQKLEEAYGITLTGATEMGDGYEILIGLDGGDAAVAEAIAQNSDGIVGVSGKKIVLMGLNLAATRQVIDCFLNKAVDGKSGSGKEITVTACEAAEVSKANLTVMSYNILYDMDKDGRSENCRDEMIATIFEKDVDVVGLQEVTEEHRKYFEANMTGYSCCAGADEYMSNDIYWKTEKFKLIKKGFFYMSDTPTVKSKYEGSNSNRTFTYVILEVKETGNQFLFIDLHADYRALDTVRAKQLAVVTSLLPKINKNDLPVVVVGDFNTTGNEASIPRFLKENPNIERTSKVAAKLGDTDGTLAVSGFVKRENTIFDYIFVTTDKIETQYYSVVNNIKNGKYPSDHLPVLAKIVVY